MHHAPLFRITLLAALLLPAGASAGILDEVPLPDIGAVTDYRPKVPLRVYSADKVLIGEFGTERRDFVPIAKMPSLMKAAVLSIEDARFYDHGGIDWIRALGAAKANLASLGSFRQGGSTITMQVARNFFLSRDKTLPRKLTEVALAYKIEQALSKDQILEVYMNQIYLGQRSYGFSSAARTYFGKPLESLSLAETAMLAGLPQNPSRHNPVANPERARERQRVVLKRMLALGKITDAQYQRALSEPLRVRRDGGGPGAGAEYVAELARQAAHARFGQAAYEHGYTVTTSINAAEQSAAYEAVRRNAIAYDRRHGYRGPEARIALPKAGEAREEAILEALQKHPAVAGFASAVVLSASPKRVRVATRDGEEIEIKGEGLALAAPALSPTAKAGSKLAPGAVVRIARAGGGARETWAIAQVPQVASAFVAIDVQTGAVRAMVGGFDYGLQKLNHATQAWRQPGSSIKPFVYSAALERGFFPGTTILDEPLDFSDDRAYANWAPRNDDGVFEGPVTIRHALTHSRNVPTVRMLRALDVEYARDHLGRFGLHGAPPGQPDPGPRHRRGDAAPAGRRLRGAGQRRLPDRTAAGDAHPGPRRQSAVRKPAQAGAPGWGARAGRPQRLHPRFHAARRGAPGHRRPGLAPAEPHRPRGQDRDHQQCHRRLVRRLRRQCGGGGVDGLRRTALAGQPRIRLHAGAAGLGRLHAGGAGEDAAARAHAARGRGAGQWGLGVCGVRRRGAGCAAGRGAGGAAAAAGAVKGDGCRARCRHTAA